MGALEPFCLDGWGSDAVGGRARFPIGADVPAPCVADAADATRCRFRVGSEVPAPYLLREGTEAPIAAPANLSATCAFPSLVRQ